MQRCCVVSLFPPAPGIFIQTGVCCSPFLLLTCYAGSKRAHWLVLQGGVGWLDGASGEATARSRGVFSDTFLQWKRSQNLYQVLEEPVPWLKFREGVAGKPPGCWLPAFSLKHVCFVLRCTVCSLFRFWMNFEWMMLDCFTNRAAAALSGLLKLLQLMRKQVWLRFDIFDLLDRKCFIWQTESSSLCFSFFLMCCFIFQRLILLDIFWINVFHQRLLFCNKSNPYCHM